MKYKKVFKNKKLKMKQFLGVVVLCNSNPKNELATIHLLKYPTTSYIIT